MFDDEVESLGLRSADRGGDSQAATLHLLPQSHYVTPREVLLEAVEKIKVELKERLEYLRGENKLVAAERLEQHPLRSGNDSGAGLLQRHRELLALSVRAGRRRGSAHPV